MVTDEGVQGTHRLLTDADEELEEKGALSIAAGIALRRAP